MGRWEPDAAGRIALAAMELYTERGFDDTTVADIAARAGLTERTFFRHFADKREVLFTKEGVFASMFLPAIVAAPADASPLEAVAAGLYSAADQFEPRLPWSRKRQAVIAANTSLQERELIKLAHVADAIAEALRGRGVSEPTASLTAQSGVGIFHVGFATWIAADNTRPFREIIAESLDILKSLTATP